MKYNTDIKEKIKEQNTNLIKILLLILLLVFIVAGFISFFSNKTNSELLNYYKNLSERLCDMNNKQTDIINVIINNENLSLNKLQKLECKSLLNPIADG
ncbi:MAG: hypothetical protein QXF25_01990 [Candidatus Pacearchaeota archaeon]